MECAVLEAGRCAYPRSFLARLLSRQLDSFVVAPCQDVALRRGSQRGRRQYDERVCVVAMPRAQGRPVVPEWAPSVRLSWIRPRQPPVSEPRFSMKLLKLARVVCTR